MTSPQRRRKEAVQELREAAGQDALRVVARHMYATGRAHGRDFAALSAVSRNFEWLKKPVKRHAAAARIQRGWRDNPVGRSLVMTKRYLERPYPMPAPGWRQAGDGVFFRAATMPGPAGYPREVHVRLTGHGAAIHFRVGEAALVIRAYPDRRLVINMSEDDDPRDLAGIHGWAWPTFRAVFRDWVTAEHQQRYRQLFDHN